MLNTHRPLFRWRTEYLEFNPSLAVLHPYSQQWIDSPYYKTKSLKRKKINRKQKDEQTTITQLATAPFCVLFQPMKTPLISVITGETPKQNTKRASRVLTKEYDQKEA